MSCHYPITEHVCAHNPTKSGTHKKRLIVCCDGTWNDSNGSNGYTTNVSRLSTAIAQKCCTGMPQVVYYHRGVGTEESLAARTIGGAFGTGVLTDIKDCYRFICENYSPGDEIVIVGFSRGAFTARSVSGMVCSIGLLNSFGLSNFGAIFDDYQDFPNWTKFAAYDEKKHLKAFNLTNDLHRQMAAKDEAEDEKEDWVDRFGYFDGKDIKDVEKSNYEKNKQRFNRLKMIGYEHNRQTERSVEVKVRKMVNKYRDYLKGFRMIHCVQGEDGKWIPEVVRVKAVGVWDTVGSLGYPKMPWRLDIVRPGRDPRELRFASRNISDRVDYAFHALALDEWRTTFKPTLWGKAEGNKTTHLRQVWFPGTHSDVGGGTEDNRNPLVSLAWMADQLSSIGVEFVPEEMVRVFRSVGFKNEPRQWGMAIITSPGGFTSVPDKVYDAVKSPVNSFMGYNTQKGSRTPGLYTSQKGDALGETHELIHPSVRIRYVYKGNDLTDKSEWTCPALTSIENGFEIRRAATDRPEWAKRPGPTYGFTYKTLTGDVSSVHGGMPIEDSMVVPKQMPFEEDLYQPERTEGWIWETLRQPNHEHGKWVWQELPAGGELSKDEHGERWVWKEMDPIVNGGEVRKVDDGERWVWVNTKRNMTLHEEQIGMWERLYIRTTKDEVEMEQRRRAKSANSKSEKDANKPQPGFFGRTFARIGRVTKAVGTAVTAPVRGAAYATQQVTNFVGDMLSTRVASKRQVLGLTKKRNQGTYGYYDFISWQHGDLRERRNLSNGGA
ncbi:hypothetical protein CGLO_02179 [Colletotrichum gloeosporioides Cg-14]|uniref:T6SS Phospholipase effector Tle1-like catalytic domain-containing protein n=1 Tax=Colletotrichum gloeosporioides (strain Cg-14) TaxID=1237896 RepID=T0KZN2_COLGC|nr:hypothetical protein CGLO_02179 [Colletotrichum gloeosporioides Cg-14]